MPRISPGIGLRLGLVGLAVILTGIALIIGLGRGWPRRQPDLVGRAGSAYARRDWGQTADLARQRLKVAPGDVEALRLLARATARLGRDAPANALFARLGSAALQAEDHYLLGIGLLRAGRTASAERVWESALAQDADHAETLDQLTRAYAVGNRPDEAAQLAERLARQPGWEMQGELIWGALRSELSDPAGAIAILARALDRPEAVRLDRTARTGYRKLLGRALLRTGRPGEARAVLEVVLQDGPDPEASWLLSRAWLLEGQAAHASTALAAAGSFRAENPMDPEPSPFVGEAQCARCHSDIFRAQQASRHTTTLLRDTQLKALPYPDQPIPDPDDPTVRHAFRRDGDRIQFETRAGDKVLDAVVAYAFGSPDHYVSLVGPDAQGRPYILRLSHYTTAHDSGWVRTTGHATDARGDREYLGKPIDGPDPIYKCLFCHATNPRAVLDRKGPESADRAIGCERCHGPGAIHIKAIGAKSADPAIVSPADAPAADRLRLCGQCHNQHLSLPSTPPRTDPFWIRFQGTTLPWSRCYTESGGALDCTTCHDPHHDADRSEAHYTARCLTCHAAGAKDPGGRPATRTDRAVRGATCPVNPVRGCVGCHMPPYESPPLHATFTDHYIRVHPGRGPQSLK